MGASVKTADFSGVKDRGAFNPKRVEEGDYAAIVTKVEDKPVKDSGEFQYEFTIKLKKYSQYSYPYRCKLAENQLWKIRNLMIAAGINVPKKRVKIDPNKVVGRQIGVTMEDDEYEGKPKSEISAVFPMSELSEGSEVASDDDEGFDEDSGPQLAGDDGSEDEAEPKSKKKGKKGKKKKGSKKDMEELDISDV